MKPRSFTSMAALTAAGALLLGATSGFRKVRFASMPTPAPHRGLKRDEQGLAEGPAARNRRQGMHNAIVKGFEIIQTLPSRERTPS